MNTKKYIAIVALVAVLAIVVVETPTFFSPTPINEATYVEPTSALHASSRTTVTDGTIALRLNAVRDASNSTTKDAWVRFNDESGLYNFSLTPPSGAAYLVANLTIANVGNSSIPFTYESFVLVAQDGTPYYPNYAVCSRDCSALALTQRKLSPNFANDLYVLFSVPSGTQPAKLQYTASNPPIVISVT
jgi:hypothetical protein